MSNHGSLWPSFRARNTFHKCSEMHSLILVQIVVHAGSIAMFAKQNSVGSQIGRLSHACSKDELDLATTYQHFRKTKHELHRCKPNSVCTDTLRNSLKQPVRNKPKKKPHAMSLRRALALLAPKIAAASELSGCQRLVGSSLFHAGPPSWESEQTTSPTFSMPMHSRSE